MAMGGQVMRVAVNGAAGAMGKRIVALVAEAEDCELVAALEAAGHPDLGKDAGVVAGMEPLGVPLSCELSGQADVLVDFSVPDAAVACARECADKGIAVVTGTTGLSAEQRAEIQERIAQRIALLTAPNMCVGVNLLYALVEHAARALPAGYDIEIVEAHHRRKKDAPSGTAMELARRLCTVLERDQDSVLRHGRHGLVGQRTADEIAIHAVRGGDMVGEHRVMFAGDGELIELVHRASSRQVFARGAMEAARFVVKQPPGLYSMQDVLA